MQDKKDYKKICGFFKIADPHYLILNPFGAICEHGFKATGFLCRKCKAYKQAKANFKPHYTTPKEETEVIYLCDRKTHTYKYDISTFDEEYNRYKAAYDIMQNAPSCHTCIKQRDCKYIKMGDHVVYNCPHYEETLKY